MSDLFSVVALIVSGLSVLFAWRSVKQSERQNEISIHNQKLVIYQAFSHLMVDLMTIGGLNVSRDDLLNFYKVERLSEFYYGRELGSELANYFMQVDELLRIRDRIHKAEKRNDPNLHEIYKEFLKLEEKCQDLGKNLDSSFREELRLVQPRQFKRVVHNIRTRMRVWLSRNLNALLKKTK